MQRGLEEHQQFSIATRSPVVNCLPTPATTQGTERTSSSSMDQATDMDENHAPSPSPSPVQSLSAVTYCCGACGYDLRLRSTDRNTAGIVGAAYGRAARRGVVAFDAIDDARFGHADEFRCVDLRARRLFVRRTRLLCRKCGASLGFGYDDRGGGGRPPRYDIRIRKLQPLAAADDDDAVATPPSDA